MRAEIIPCFCWEWRVAKECLSMRQEMMSIGFALSALDSIVTCADIDCYKETQEPSISVQSRLPCRLFRVVCIDRWSSIETMDKEGCLVIGLFLALLLTLYYETKHGILYGIPLLITGVMVLYCTNNGTIKKRYVPKTKED
jgi:hypothetical protein